MDEWSSPTCVWEQSKENILRLEIDKCMYVAMEDSFQREHILYMMSFEKMECGLPMSFFKSRQKIKYLWRKWLN